jgi:hypothetical protein
MAAPVQGLSERRRTDEESSRQRGLAEALLLCTVNARWIRGQTAVELKVEATD